MSLRNVTRNLAVGIAAGALLIAASSVASAQNNGTVTGVINDASGQPVAGAFVKLKNDEKRLTFMVISREQGRFDAKDLPPGTYRVQGVGGGFQSQWFDNVTVTNGGEGAKVGLALTEQAGPGPGAGVAAAHPGGRRPQGLQGPEGPAGGRGQGARRREVQLLPRPRCVSSSSAPIATTGATRSSACARAW